MIPARARGWLPYAAPASAGVFLALQGADQAIPLAWGVLTLGGCVALLGNRIDWRGPALALERSLLAVLDACLLGALCGVDRTRSLLLSVPIVAAVLLWLLTVRSGQADAARFALRAGLGIAAASQVVLLLAAAIRDPHAAPAEWVMNAGAAWLIVPNDIAWIGCALPLFAATARRPNIALIVLLAAYLLLCVLLRSRTAGAVASASALWFLVSTAAWRRRQVAITLGAVGLVALAIVTPGIASMHARAQLWSAAVSIFLDHPLTGVGVHNFVSVYRSYLPPDYDWIDGRLTPWPHDLALEVAAESGLAGIIAGLFLCGSLLRWVYAQRASCDRGYSALCSALLGLGMLALVEASLLRQWFWFFGTTLCALAVLQPRCAANANGE